MASPSIVYCFHKHTQEAVHIWWTSCLATTKKQQHILSKDLLSCVWNVVYTWLQWANKNTKWKHPFARAFSCQPWAPVNENNHRKLSVGRWLGWFHVNFFLLWKLWLWDRADEVCTQCFEEKQQALRGVDPASFSVMHGLLGTLRSKKPGEQATKWDCAHFCNYFWQSQTQWTHTVSENASRRGFSFSF